MNKKTAIQRIFLIRHGQSQQNIGLTPGQNIFDGDDPLSPLGERQAYEAGAVLKKYLEKRKIPLNLSALWESPYLRAEQTANGIKKHIRFFHNYQDPRLVERDMGLFDNIVRETWDEIASAETHITKYTPEFSSRKIFLPSPARRITTGCFRPRIDLHRKHLPRPVRQSFHRNTWSSDQSHADEDFSLSA